MGTSTIQILLIAWGGAAVVMMLLWVVQRVRSDAGIVDVGWAASIGVLGVYFGVVSVEGYVWRRALVVFLMSVWSFRLAYYLFVDRIWGKEEDGRYQALREQWGKTAQTRFFFFFQVQAAVAVLFAMPGYIVMRGGVEFLNIWDFMGVLTWVTAVIGEGVSDRQLARFRSDARNKGRTCRVGLWGYSRHPNYFFEWVHWWSYVFMGMNAAYGWVNLFAPVLMFYFLFKVTGIPYTEQQAVKSRGDDYREYQKTTSVFIPWFPKKRGDKR